MSANTALIEQYKRLLITRMDIHGVQTVNGYVTRKESLTDALLLEHFEGKTTLLAYSLSKKSTVKFICWDVDCKDLSEAERMTFTLLDTLDAHDLPADLIEFSGKKGYHIFVFCNPDTNAATTKDVGLRIVRAAGLSDDKNDPAHVEVFPKQDKLPRGGVGNGIKLPLGLHKGSGKFSHFVKPEGSGGQRQLNTLTEGEALEVLEAIQPRELDPSSLPEATTSDPATKGRGEGDEMIEACKRNIPIPYLVPSLLTAAPGQWKGGQDCPLDSHAGKPFSIYGDGDAFKCHSCDVQGDVFAFVMAKYNCTFPQAKQRLLEQLPRDVREGLGLAPEQARVKHVGVLVDNDNATIVEKIYTSFMNRVIEVICDPEGMAYAKLQIAKGKTVLIPVEPGSNGEAARYMRRYYNRDYSKVPSRPYVNSALDMVIAAADENKSDYPFHLRTGKCNGSILYNLNSNNQVIRFDRDGSWQITNNTPIEFRTNRFCKPIMMPADEPADITSIRYLLNVEDDDLPLIYAWLTHCLFSDIPYVILNFLGEAGTGKTTAAKMLRMIIDPNEFKTSARSHSIRNLAAFAYHTFVLPVDNISNIAPEMSDFLCGVATGSYDVSRKMRTNYDLAGVKIHNPVLLTSIAPPTVRNDFQSRCLPITLQPLARIVEEGKLWENFEHIQHSIFKGVVESVATAHSKWNSLDGAGIRWPRMADFAKVGYLAAPCWGLTGDAWLDLYRGKLTEGLHETLDSSPILEPLIVLMRTQKDWTGTSKDLLMELEMLCEGAEALNHHTRRDWPKTPQTMSYRLREIATALRVNEGWTVEDARVGGRRVWHIAVNESQQSLESVEVASA